MKDFSLLHPPGKDHYFTLEANTIDALSLDFIVEHLTRNLDEQMALREILIQMPIDPEIIKYRQNIYRDLRDFPEMCKKFSAICKEMEFYGITPFVSYEQNSTIWDFISRLNDLANYCSSIIQIKECLDAYPLKSQGLLQLKDYVDSIYNDNGFP